MFSTDRTFPSRLGNYEGKRDFVNALLNTHIFQVRGFQVAPAELEGCLLDHPDVSNACVVGVPDDYSALSFYLNISERSDASRRGGSARLRGPHCRRRQEG